MIFQATETTMTFFFCSVVQIKPPSTGFLLWRRALISVANIYLLMALRDDSSLAKFQSGLSKCGWWPEAHSSTSSALPLPLSSNPHCPHPSSPFTLTLTPSPIPHVLIGCVEGALTALTQKSRGFTARPDPGLQSDASWCSGERCRFPGFEGSNMTQKSAPESCWTHTAFAQLTSDPVSFWGLEHLLSLGLNNWWNNYSSWEVFCLDQMKPDDGRVWLAAGREPN